LQQFFHQRFPLLLQKQKAGPATNGPVAGNAFVRTLRSSLRRALPLDGLMLQAVWGQRKAVIQLFYVIYSLCDVPMHFSAPLYFLCLYRQHRTIPA
jgi:hypothetical protein